MKKQILPFALFLTGLAACSSGSGSGAPSPSGSPSTVATAAPEEEAVTEEPGLKVTNKGAAPQTKLRYQVADGATETLTLSQFRSEALVGQKPRKPPATKLTIALTSKGKTAAGDSEWAYEVKDAMVEEDKEVSGAIVKQTQAALKKVIGLNGKFLVSSRGVVRKAEPSLPAGADAVTTQLANGLADSIQSAFVPLPGASVGAGGKWEYATDSRQAGAMVKMVTNYEIVSVSGDEVKIKATQTQQADKQTLDMGGAKLQISGYKMEGSFDITLNLKHLGPRQNLGETKGSMTLEGMGKAAKQISITSKVSIIGT